MPNLSNVDTNDRQLSKNLTGLPRSIPKFSGHPSASQIIANTNKLSENIEDIDQDDSNNESKNMNEELIDMGRINTIKDQSQSQDLSRDHREFL